MAPRRDKIVVYNYCILYTEILVKCKFNVGLHRKASVLAPRRDKIITGSCLASSQWETTQLQGGRHSPIFLTLSKSISYTLKKYFLHSQKVFLKLSKSISYTLKKKYFLHSQKVFLTLSESISYTLIKYLSDSQKEFIALSKSPLKTASITPSTNNFISTTQLFGEKKLYLLRMHLCPKNCI